MNPEKLELYSFWWSEARLVIAAVALFIGGVPPVYYALPFDFFVPFIGIGLMLAWIISGLVSLYLVYRWLENGQRIFGGKNPLDLAAFAVMIISGINLGAAGFLGTNFGMRISSAYVVFILTGLIYLASAYYLYTRYEAHGKKLF